MRRIDPMAGAAGGEAAGGITRRLLRWDQTTEYVSRVIEQRRRQRRARAGAAAAAAAAAATAAKDKDEMEKLLRENPSLRNVWTDLTDTLLKGLSPLIFAPLLVHWIKTRHECNVSTPMMISTSVFQILAAIVPRLLRTIDPHRHSTTSNPRYVALAYVGCGFMWVGYGQGMATAPSLKESNLDACSIARVSIMAMAAMTASTISFAMNIHLSRHVFRIAFNTIFCYALPTLICHVTGIAPYNHHLSFRVSRWDFVRDAVAAAAAAAAGGVYTGSSSLSSSEIHEARVLFLLFWIDVLASTARVLAMYLFIPYFIAARLQYAYVYALLTPPPPPPAMEIRFAPGRGGGGGGVGAHRSSAVFASASGAGPSSSRGGERRQRPREEVFLEFFEKVKRT